ncbi:MAG TPA: tetratricopeptide repeat protein [Steroidobacteraceae bacterium]|jgi:tetratricopeptide (TPR) repeat protein|nr:tetratricopeptide repeat protein [Steroidobacteraceae bacterium]
MPILIDEDPGQPRATPPAQLSGAPESAAAFMSPDLETQPELAASIYNAAGLAYFNRGHVELARKHIERALEIRRSFYGDEHPAVAESLHSRARLHRHDGDLRAAEADIRRALGIQTRVDGRGSLAVAATLWELSVIQLEALDLVGAERSAQEGLRNIEQLYLEHCDPHVPRLLDVIARVRSSRGEHTQAAEIYSRVLHLVAEKQGKEHPKYAVYLANLGSVEQARGNCDEAEECYRRAMSIYERVNERHPNLSGVYANMGTLLQETGAERHHEARSFLRKALLLSETIWGREHHFHAYDQYNLARLEFDAGNVEEARQLAEAALQTYSVKQPDGGYTAGAMMLVGRAILDDAARDESSAPSATELQRAKALLGDAMPIMRREYGERSVPFALARGLLGRTRFLLGDKSAEPAKLLAAAHACASELGGADDRIAQQLAGWMQDAQQSALPAPAGATQSAG